MSDDLDAVKTWADEVAGVLGKLTITASKLGKEVTLVPEIAGEIGYGFGDKTSPLEIEVLLRVPKEALDKRDHVTGVFLEKRKEILGRAKELFKSSEFESWSDRYPVLVVNPDSSDVNAKIIVDVVFPEDFAKLSRFSPEISNLRLSWFRDNECPPAVKHLVPKNEDDAPDTVPSPFTNGLYARGLVRRNCHALSCKILSEGNVNIRDAYRLVCLWLKRRRFLANRDGFSKMMVALLLAYLSQKKRIHRDMSSYQIVRNFWTFISEFVASGSSIVTYQKLFHSQESSDMS